jgi:hypothetical protein
MNDPGGRKGMPSEHGVEVRPRQIAGGRAWQAISSRSAEAGSDILLRLENPKLGRIYDAEVIGDGIAIGLPVLGDLVAQEAKDGVTEIVELGVTAVVSDGNCSGSDLAIRLSRR